MQVMERTLPDSGTGLSEWWSKHGRQDGSWTWTTYGELIDRAGPAGERHASTVSVSLDLKAASAKRIGQIEDAQQGAEYNDVFQQEALTAVHGILRTTGLIAVSAQDPDELERAVADIEQAAIQAACETRRLWGQQAQAFSAAALPLCRSV